MEAALNAFAITFGDRVPAAETTDRSNHITANPIPPSSIAARNAVPPASISFSTDAISPRKASARWSPTARIRWICWAIPLLQVVPQRGARLPMPTQPVQRVADNLGQQPTADLLRQRRGRVADVAELARQPRPDVLADAAGVGAAQLGPAADGPHQGGVPLDLGVPGLLVAGLGTGDQKAD